jgi:hypothetical protein
MTRPALAAHGVTLEASDLRAPAGVMIAAGALLPLLPAGTGVGCPLRALTGVPCPLCGMTTSVVAATHLRFEEALAANPAGIAVTAAAVAILAFRPRRLRIAPLVVYPVLLALWLFELHRFGFL